MILKRNKTRIYWDYTKKIVKDYFNWVWWLEIAIKYWFDITTIRKYLRSKATKNYTENWKDYRRCTICSTYRLTKYFWLTNKTNLKAYCNICEKRKAKNTYLINKVDNIEKLKTKNRVQWLKHKHKINLKRDIRKRVNNIIT